MKTFKNQETITISLGILMISMALFHFYALKTLLFLTAIVGIILFLLYTDRKPFFIPLLHTETPFYERLGSIVALIGFAVGHYFNHDAEGIFIGLGMGLLLRAFIMIKNKKETSISN